jgi:Ala-tRNA(Pro) deacylase
MTMQIPKQLIDCLDASGASYEILQHPAAVTAQRVAEVEHIKARHHAKVVMVKSNENHLMTVIPADQRIDLQKVEKLTGKPASLESEQDFKAIFSDCAVGAMPPFGNLYGLQTYVDEKLTQQDYIVFEAGTHTDAIKLKYSDYEKIVKPLVSDLTM